MTNNFPKINFIGNKHPVSKWICDKFPNGTTSVLDLFSGGSSISYEAKKRGFQVVCNDRLHINYLISTALIENNKHTLNDEEISNIFKGKSNKGFMTMNFKNKFFFENECMDLDLYRSNILKLKNKFKRALAFSILRRSMIRKMPYSRFNIKWDKIVQLRDEEYSYKHYKRKRAYHNLSFKEHFIDNVNAYNSAVFDNGKENKAMNSDALNVASKSKCDIVYCDPPYSGTMNNYASFYGLLDMYVKNKKNISYKDLFTKEMITKTFDKLFSSIKKSHYLILSYNNNAYPKKDVIISLLEQYSKNIKVYNKKHSYKITGKEKKDTNTETLFIAEL